MRLRPLTLCSAAALASACSSSDGTGAAAPGPTVVLAPEGNPFETLAEWGFFADAPAQIPAAGVVPFDVISVLFADDARKERFLYLPPGEQIGWSDIERWDFPAGTTAIKTFWYPNDARDDSLGRRLVETRLLVMQPSGLEALTYVWNDAQTAAKLELSGSTATVSWTDDDGELRDQQYNIPNAFDCQSCHGVAPETHLLGPRTRQLDRDHDYGSGPENQIDHMASLGWLDTAPPAERVRLTDPYGDGPVVERARSYLDANCSHCHSEGGKAESTGLWVSYDLTDPDSGDRNHIGVCKFPTSAGNASGGLKYDVWPGSPDQSIMILRVGSTDPSVKMPPLLTRLSDSQGVKVLREWIAAMPAENCDAP